MSNVKMMLLKIKEHINDNCGITGDKVKVYEYEKNITVQRLKDILLKTKDVTIVNQVLNYNNKILAL